MGNSQKKINKSVTFNESFIEEFLSEINKQEHISDVHLALNSTILRESLNSLLKDDDWERIHGNAIRFLASFRAEILIKGLIYLCGESYKASHNLLNLFNKLPNNLKEEVIHRYFLMKDLPLNKENRKSFLDDLRNSKSIFVDIRYPHTFKGLYSREDMRQKVISNWNASPRFLLLFSEALQHTYVSLMGSDQNINSERKFSRQKNMLTNYKN